MAIDPEKKFFIEKKETLTVPGLELERPDAQGFENLHHEEIPIADPGSFFGEIEEFRLNKWMGAEEEIQSVFRVQ